MGMTKGLFRTTERSLKGTVILGQTIFSWWELWKSKVSQQPQLRDQNL